MPTQPLQLLERSLEPVVAEFMRLVFSFMAATSIACGVLAAVMFLVYLIAAWRDAHAGRAALRVQAGRLPSTPKIGLPAGSPSHPSARTRPRRPSVTALHLPLPAAFGNTSMLEPRMHRLDGAVFARDERNR